MNRDERREYWALPIAFDCPITKGRHMINTCFNACQENDYDYKETGDGRTAGFLYCLVNQRYMHNGEVRRRC